MISPEFPTTADSGVSPRDAGGGRNSFARAIVASNSRADPHHDRILRNRGNPALASAIPRLVGKAVTRR
jgi:hypothetical protein